MPFLIGIFPKPEHFPSFGNDLVLRGDGSGNTNFPYCYGEYSNKKIEFMENESFMIRYIEVFAVREI